MNIRETELTRFAKFIKEFGVPNADVLLKKFLAQNPFISNEIIGAIKFINNKFNGEVVFCGSLALVLNGFLEREVHDLDVFTFEDTFTNGRLECNNGSSGQFQMDGMEINIYKVQHETINIDVMYKTPRLKYTYYKFDEVLIKIETPASAIKAKKCYIMGDQLLNKEKHANDLKFIKSKLSL